VSKNTPTVKGWGVFCPFQLKEVVARIRMSIVLKNNRM